MISHDWIHIDTGFEMNKNNYCIESSLIPSKTRAQRETRDVPCKTDANHCTSQNMREQEAILYLKEKRIPDIIDFLMGDLLVRRPYDPFEYLTQLLDKCILSRNGLVDPPSSFSLR
ncbi:uncharacterized protein LOC115236339 [Formica exsecta]|uniref:uncharacterized protein LOC115236339 n=1 Tax=Formica exsecta TaxID=72781 RepID=UPI0011426A06|nr:uncharacterized protein LOC115236339 [Formica exsecta]